MALPGPRGNSNNWVVAGRKTKSGQPILANDPHLQIEFPSVWYQMHLVAADLDVTGVTIPGVPFIALGHNAKIAWGMTNTGADVQDLYLEHVDVAKKRAMYHGEWVPVEVTPVDIPVKGGGKVSFEIWKTRRGPIFADAGSIARAAGVVVAGFTRGRRRSAPYSIKCGCRRRSGRASFEPSIAPRIGTRSSPSCVLGPFIGHCLRRRRRQHRLRDVGPVAGAG